MALYFRTFSSVFDAHLSGHNVCKARVIDE